MPRILTDRARLTCPHQGTVTLVASQSKLTIQNGKALVQGDLMGAVITGCTNPPQSGGPCTNVATVTGGASLRTKVDNKGALLDTVVAVSNVPGMVINVMDPGQTRFDTT